MPDIPTTALIKTDQSPALARVSNQLALTDKLLTKPEEPFLIPYRKGDKWGFCDRNKNVVIECFWDKVERFADGMAAIMKHGKWGYINKVGELIVAPKYASVRSFSEGLAAISYD